MWDAAWIRQIGNDEPSHVGEGLDRPGQIFAVRLIEVEQDGQEVTLAQLLAQSVKDRFALWREAAQDQHGLGSNGVNDTANSLIIEEDINELGDLDVINSN